MKSEDPANPKRISSRHTYDTVNEIVDAGERFSEALQDLGPRLGEIVGKFGMEKSGFANVVRQVDRFVDGFRNFRGVGEGGGSYPADLVTGLYHVSKKERKEGVQEK